MAVDPVEPAEAPRRRSARGADTRRRILAGARRVLAEEGIERFTTRRVSERAGISHGMCHYHFKDKLDLVQALVEDARSDWVEPLEAIVQGPGSAHDRARLVIDWMAEPATIEVMRVHLTLFWYALRNDAVRRRLSQEYGGWRAPFIRLFEDLARERGLEDLDAAAVGEAFASAADGLVQQQSLDPDLDTHRLLTALFNRIAGAGGHDPRSSNSR
ncbi:MAG: TetR/AcrR family transcriptional regulator [Actinomycetota bacterium]